MSANLPSVKIAPHVMKWDEASAFPMATVKELGKLGLLGIIFPPEYGGAVMGYVEYVTAIEELSRRGWLGGDHRRRAHSLWLEPHFYCWHGSAEEKLH